MCTPTRHRFLAAAFRPARLQHQPCPRQRPQSRHLSRPRQHPSQHRTARLLHRHGSCPWQPAPAQRSQGRRRRLHRHRPPPSPPRQLRARRQRPGPLLVPCWRLPLAFVGPLRPQCSPYLQRRAVHRWLKVGLRPMAAAAAAAAATAAATAAAEAEAVAAAAALAAAAAPAEQLAPGWVSASSAARRARLGQPQSRLSALRPTRARPSLCPHLSGSGVAGACRQPVRLSAARLRPPLLPRQLGPTGPRCTAC
jgi:hypothetical protein